ncbi:MAG TPA: bifunctional glycosyltransferase family 2/GtrA family protein [Candidatus Paceibacterota bacterium]|nr:bifunctional glycosyltransferase family 2/GtrA family protein [Candidatus Paceibacterota bacterium]
MKLPISLSLFFPAHNEEDNIADVIHRAARVVGDSPYIREFEIIVVDDGSTDKTFEIASELQSYYRHLRVIRHPRNLGYGAALKTGIREARMQYVFFTDADLQFDILELQNLLVHLEDYDVVIGYRAPRRDPLMRLINARGWNLLNRIFFGLQVRDIDCAFKIFKRSLIQDLKLESNGAMINAEILIKLKREGLAIKEVPVSHLPRRAGLATGAKLNVIFRALREMLALYGGELGSITHKQVVRFATVGVINTLVDAAFYLFLTRATLFFTGVPVGAKLFSFLAGTISSFLLNRYWTFGMREEISFAEIGRFYTTVSISLFVNVAAMQVLINLGMYDLVALVFATAASFLTNFTLSRTWVFKQRPQAVLKPQQ